MDLFRVRLNCVDHYQAVPTPFDPILRSNVQSSQLHKEPKIPVVRVFGATETGQKVCAHIHGAFPYLYVEYAGSLKPDDVGVYIQRLHLSIDYALAVSYRRNPYDGKSKFVARITLVKGTPFYGFHVGYKYYLKIYMLNPMVMTRVGDLLRQGAVMKKVFQPYEAHLQFILQWMADFNLYGCGFIDCSKVSFRSPVPTYDEMQILHLWHDRSIPLELRTTDEPNLPRVSRCAIEVDICVQDILNRHDIRPRQLHHDFIERLNPIPLNEKLVHSMAGLWKDETRRRKSKLSNPDPGSSPFPADVMISMSADPRSSNMGDWIHEEEYRERIAELIKDEKDKSDGAKLSFDNFVDKSPFESSINTSLESVEDLFPEKLRHAMGSTSGTGTNYEIYDDEQREVDENSIKELKFKTNDNEDAEYFYDSDEEIMREMELSQRKQGDHVEAKQAEPEKLQNTGGTRLDISRNGTTSSSGLSKPGTVNSSRVQNGHAHDSRSVMSESAQAINSHLNAKPILKRSEPPIVNANSDEKRQRVGSLVVAESILQNSTTRMPSPLEMPLSKHLPAENDRIDMDMSGKAKPRSTKPQKSTVNGAFHIGSIPTLEDSLTDLPSLQDRSQRQSLNFPVVKDPNDPNTILRLSQKSSSQSSASDVTRKQVSFAPTTKLPTISDDTKRTSSTPAYSSRTESVNLVNTVLRNMQDEFSKFSQNVVLGIKEAPPPFLAVSTSLDQFNLPSVIYQDAYYSNESDVPERAREWAGKEFKLESLSVPFLPEFDPTGTSAATFGEKVSVVPDKVKEEKIRQYRREGCSLRSWEIAEQPPTFRDVAKWLQDETALKNASVSRSSVPQETVPIGKHTKGLSQIDGPTQKNKHGFKYTQNQAATSVQHEVQYMSIMSLEVHINTRGNLVPNPEEDEVQSVFWCLQSQDEVTKSNGVAEGTCVGIVTQSEDGDIAQRISRQSGIDVQEESSELDLIVRMVEIVMNHDPDILTGYEVHGGSWGYLIERARLKYEYNLCDEFSRTNAQSHGRFGKDSDKWGFNNTSTIRVTGRHMINIWRAMRGELNLLQYTLENVAFHLLHRRVPHFTWADLTKWYTNNKPRDLAKVVDYYVSRVQLNLEILEKNELVARTSEQARLLGVDFFSVFSRGSQFKVESLMFRIAKPESLILVSPSRKQVGGQNALECLPLVMEPQSAFYTSPVLVLDFQSLYPSVMIAYNYCYSTFLGRVVNWRGTNKMGFTEYKRQARVLEMLKDHINIAPNGIMYTKPDIRKSLLAKMLGEILETRVMVKSGMKIDKDDKALQRLLNNRQLALKLIANVTYGYTSASFSGRMPCSEIADSIVQTGRETLEKAIALIHSVKRWGAEVVYGDTDSIFVSLKGRTKDQAFDIGEEIARTITNMNPRPIKLKFEKVYHPCVLLAKKRYVGFKYEHRNQVEPDFDAKGIETVRRDGTPAEQKIEEKALKILFRTSDLSQVKTYFQQQCEKIMRGSVSIQDFCFAKEVKLGTYSDHGPPPPGAVISTKRMLEDARAEPQYGERVPYVVITGAPGARLIDRCVAPEELLDSDQNELDAEYYISKNLIPPLERIFNLVGANVRNWYDEMPKVQRIRKVDVNLQLQGQSRDLAISKKTLESYMRSSSCLVCRRKLETESPICPNCLMDKPTSTLILRTRLNNEERKLMDIESICQSCSGISPLDEVKCDSKDCPVFYTRTKQKSKVKTERALVEPVMTALVDNEKDGLDW